MQLLILFFVLFIFVTVNCEIIRTVAGIAPFSGDGLLAQNAVLQGPRGIFVSQSNQIYFTDSNNHVVRKIDQSGIITTIAGVGGNSGSDGNGGLATQARLNYPQSVFVTPNEDIYISEGYNNDIRKIFASNGTIITIAGGPILQLGDGGPAWNASLSFPSEIFVSSKDEIYIADTLNHAIRKIFVNGTITTIAGISGQSGYTGNFGPATAATLNRPVGIFVSPRDELYFTDNLNHVIRKVFPNGTIITFAGTGTVGYNGNGGPALNADMYFPQGIIGNEQGEIYVAEGVFNIIRKISQNGTIELVAGSGSTTGALAGDGGLATSASFNGPYGLALSNSLQKLYITDEKNNAIRQIDLNTGIITSLIKLDPASTLATRNKLYFPSGVAVNPVTKDVIIADTYNYCIKKVDAKNGTISIIAGKLGQPGADGDNRLATDSLLFMPYGVFVAMDQTIYIADTYSATIRKINPVNQTIHTIVGHFYLSSFSGDGQLAINARLNLPHSVFVAQNGDMYIADTSNHCIRKVFAKNNTITTIAGVPTSKGAGANQGIATSIQLNAPEHVIVSQYTGEVYIADTLNNCIRKILTNGTMITVAGLCGVTVTADNYMLIRSNVSTNVLLFSPKSIGLSMNDSLLYIADTYAYVIRKVNLRLNTIQVAIGNLLSYGFTGENLESNSSFVKLYTPSFVHVTPWDTLYIADTYNNAIRKVAPLCSNYQLVSQLQQVNSNRLETKLQRSCQRSDGDWFETLELPVVEFTYQSNQKLARSIALQWNQQTQIPYSSESLLLDIIQISWKACQTNCVFSEPFSPIVFGVVPSNVTNTIVMIPHIISSTLIHYYKGSSSISSFALEIVYLNQRTNIIDLTFVISSLESSSQIINNLQHNTTYQVSITVRVVYQNGMQTSNRFSTQMMRTEVGISPSATVQNIELELLPNNIPSFSWKSIPISEQGNVPVSKLQILYDIMQSQTELSALQMIELNYDAATNQPNVVRLDTIQLEANRNYQFWIRACNAIGCSNSSDAMQLTTGSANSDNVSSSGSTAAAVIIILLLLCLGLAILIIAVIIVVVIITVVLLKRKKISSGSTLESSRGAELAEYVGKEFHIEQQHLDFSNSIFLGNGASGSVITAQYFNRDVAIKLVNTVTAGGSENDLSDFYNELQFLHRNARHYNIIRFFGVYHSEEKHQVGLVMEFCRNGSVAQYVMQTQLSFFEKVSVAQGIANGMQYLHFNDMAHRDLKCENILLDDQFTPKIIDFGFSRIIGTNTTNQNLTMNVGTAVYCAPEVIQLQWNSTATIATNTNTTTNTSNASQQQHSQSSHSNHSQAELSLTSNNSQTVLSYDKKCDVFSFAICMWVIYFQNKNPYGTTATNQVLYMLSTKPDFRPVVQEKSIPANEMWYIDLMKKCWSSNPEDRPNFEEVCKIFHQHTAKRTGSKMKK